MTQDAPKDGACQAPAQHFSHSRGNESYSYNSLCTWSTARHSRYGMRGHGLVVNKVVLGLCLDSTILEIFSNLNIPIILCKKVHFTALNSPFPNLQAGTCIKVQPGYLSP